MPGINENIKGSGRCVRGSPCSLKSLSEEGPGAVVLPQTLSSHWLGNAASALQSLQCMDNPRPGNAGEEWESPDRAQRGTETGRDGGEGKDKEGGKGRGLVSRCHFPGVMFLGRDFSFDYSPLSVSQDPVQVACGEGDTNTHWNSGGRTTFKHVGYVMCDRRGVVYKWAIRGHIPGGVWMGVCLGCLGL